MSVEPTTIHSEFVPTKQKSPPYIYPSLFERPVRKCTSCMPETEHIASMLTALPCNKMYLVVQSYLIEILALQILNTSTLYSSHPIYLYHHGAKSISDGIFCSNLMWKSIYKNTLMQNEHWKKGGTDFLSTWFHWNISDLYHWKLNFPLYLTSQLKPPLVIRQAVNLLLWCQTIHLCCQLNSHKIIQTEHGWSV